jgi:hypothetical protein
VPVTWTAEKIAAKSTDEVKALRENAIRHGANDVLALCNDELSRRGAAKKAPTVRGKQNRRNEPVVGYHFVCRPEEKGVTRNLDGTAWSGTWVVSESQAERSLKTGAYVALHLSHADACYMHGTIRAWRRSPRESEYAEGQEVKTPIGTEFLLELTDERLPWRGEGTVERSYVYEIDVDDEE